MCVYARFRTRATFGSVRVTGTPLRALDNELYTLPLFPDSGLSRYALSFVFFSRAFDGVDIISSPSDGNPFKPECLLY